VVWLFKEGRDAMATVWVKQVTQKYVFFRAGKINMELMVIRTGPDLERITDDDRIPMKIFEYLGKV